jgi:MFS family permease
VYAAFLVVSVVSGALLLPFGRTADTRGRRPVMALGLALGAIGFVLLAVLPGAAGLILGMALLGVAGAADSVAPGAVMGDVLGGRGGSVVAAFQMAGDLGAVLGPVAGGLLVDTGGYPVALLVTAAVTLAPVALVRIAPETLVTNVVGPRVSSSFE